MLYTAFHVHIVKPRLYGPLKSPIIFDPDGIVMDLRLSSAFRKGYVDEIGPYG